MTRLTKRERRMIAAMAAAGYRNAGREIVENNPTARHAAFSGPYAERFVWRAAVSEIGEKRAEKLSGDNFARLIKDAKFEVGR